MTESINAHIAGTGAYVPDTVITNEDLAERFNTTAERIRTMTGITERHIAGETQATSDLAVEAARRALIDAGIESADVDLVIVSTLCPDFIGPSTACIVQERLGMRRAAAFDLGAACSGFVYSLAVGSRFIASAMYETVLVIGSDLVSRFTDWGDFDTAILAGDGAGAVVLRPGLPGYGVLSVYLGADGCGAKNIYVPAGGTRMEATAENMAANMHKMRLRGQEVFMFAMRVIPEATETALQMAGISREEVALIIPHQANLRIIEAAARRMNLSMDRFMVNLDRYGNTSSASIPIALNEALETRRVNKGDVIVLTGFGAGLTWGSAVIRC